MSPKKSRTARSARPTWPALMKRTTAAEYCDVSPCTFRRWVKAGHLEEVFPGDMRDAMFRRQDIDAFLAGLRPSIRPGRPRLVVDEPVVPQHQLAQEVA